MVGPEPAPAPASPRLRPRDPNTAGQAPGRQTQCSERCHLTEGPESWQGGCPAPTGSHAEDGDTAEAPRCMHPAPEAPAIWGSHGHFAALGGESME